MMYGGTIAAKTGEAVPLFSDQKPMHSKYNPRSEAAQFAQSAGEAKYGAVVVAGLGGGFHLTELLETSPLVIACEDDEESLAFCRTLGTVRELEKSKRLRLATEKTLGQVILESYLPHVHKSISFMAHRAWEDRAQVCCSNMRAVTSAAVRHIGADYSVQAHFARLWQRNIFLNLRTFTGNPDIGALFDTTRTAAVIAAGPSLDRTAKEILRERDSLAVFATDTTLPVLLRRGIVPDAAVSIDAQHISSEHFLCLRGLKDSARRPVCFFDAAADPGSIRIAREAGCRTVLTHNGHPLLSLAEAQGAGIPRIQSGSGTVAIAACDVARRLGFTRLRLYGADFAYSGGKPYARGTYLDGLYANAADRLLPAEGQFCALMLRTELYDAARPGLSGARTTAVLDGYREALLAWKEEHGFTEEDGLFRTARTVPGGTFCGGPGAGFDFTAFARDWRKRTAQDLEREDGELTPWLCTLLPLTAWLERTLPPSCDRRFFSLAKLAYSYCLRYTE